MHPILIVVGMMISVVGCASESALDTTQQTEEPLYGGRPDKAEEWTNVVALGDQCTGVLLHPRLVVFAAHCGASFDSIRSGEKEVRIKRCKAHPDAPSANASTLLVSNAVDTVDLAFCILERPISTQIIPMLTKKEYQQLRIGTRVILVGHGGDGEDSEFGVRRVAQAHITNIDVDEEFTVAANGVGTCQGDSGGPAFIETCDGSFRLAGVLSSSLDSRCAEK